MEWDVVAHISGVHTRTALQQSLHKLGVALFSHPMQRAEAMVVSKVYEFICFIYFNYGGI